MSMKLEEASEDLSTLEVSLLCLSQTSTMDLSLMQIASPARLLCEARAVYSAPIDFDAYLADIKNAKKASRELKEFAKDKQNGVEQQFAQLVAKSSSCDFDDIRREYDEMLPRVNERMISSDKREEAQEFIQKALQAFSTQNISQTFSAIGNQGGNPTIIVVYGHGGHRELVAPDGGYDHLKGSDFANFMHQSTLRPKFVLFVCCYAYGVAKDAQQTWEDLGQKGCFFVGPTVEERAEAVFSSHAVPVRFIHEYLRTSVLLRFDDKVEIFFDLPSRTKKALWVRTRNIATTHSLLWGLFLVCIKLQPIIGEGLYYLNPGVGCYCNVDAAIEAQNIWRKTDYHIAWKTFFVCNDLPDEPLITLEL